MQTGDIQCFDMVKQRSGRRARLLVGCNQLVVKVMGWVISGQCIHRTRSLSG
jgi:hypothetical protein